LFLSRDNKGTVKNKQKENKLDLIKIGKLKDRLIEIMQSEKEEMESKK
jgi:hypothetical protein